MSTHKVEVVRLGPVLKHPNADSLEYTQVWGYTAIARIGDFKEGELAVYVEPDYVVPDTSHPEGHRFAFLGDKRRIKARRLRGMWSQGLLVKLNPTDTLQEGDDVLEAWGIARYEPPILYAPRGPNSVKSGSLGGEKPPEILASLPKYDLESLRRHSRVLSPSEEVYVTEKIHGANARYTYQDGRMWCGSRSMWKKEAPNDLWWVALAQNPWIESFCMSMPDTILYGEVFGQVQDLKYGTKQGEVKFLAFDIFDLVLNRWMDCAAFFEITSAWASLNGGEEHIHAPLLYQGPYDFEKLEELSRQDSVIGPHLSEGLVIKPASERQAHCGRVAFKLVSDRYLER